MSNFITIRDFDKTIKLPFTAIAVRHFTSILRDGWAPAKADEKSEKMLAELFETLHTLKPAINHGDQKWILWTSIRRPSLSEYIASSHALDYDEDDEITDEELKRFWEEEYPDEEVWYQLTFVQAELYRTKIPYYGVWVDGDYIIGINDPNVKDHEALDETEFISWLTSSVNDVIQAVRVGSYNAHVASDLPCKYREGTIFRKDLYDAYPEGRKELRQDLTQEEIDKFCALAKKTEIPEEERIRLTTRDFFEACTLGYKASGYETRKIWRFEETEEEKEKYKGDYTPREYYSMYADGRDDCLVNVPMDDSAAFAEWREQKGPYYEFNGHHPFEVVGRYNISHSIHLFPHFEGETGYFVLSCKALSTSYEVVKWMNAIADKFPILLYDGAQLAARFEETDRVGIAPCTKLVMSGDNDSFRIGYDVLDAIQLSDGYEKILDKITWIPEHELVLADEEED